MTKQVNSKSGTLRNTTPKKSTLNNSNKKKRKKRSKEEILYSVSSKKHNFLMSLVVALIGVIMIFSTYAWLSVTLNVKINNFKMQVKPNSGLTISLDGITFGHYVEVSYESIIERLRNTYSNNTSQWALNGLTPVSSNGISSPNNDKFDVYASHGGVKYKNKKKDIGYIATYLVKENKINPFNAYIAFDIFLKNESGSPISDNLYLDYTTFLETDTEVDNYEYDEEMQGLVNSARIGFVKIGSVPLKSPVDMIQNVQCNNNCQMLIYEPNNSYHTDLSIERSLKYGINLKDGEYFPTFAFIKAGGPIEVRKTISGSVDMDYNYFKEQKTITEADFVRPIFQIPDGITKARIYIWLEGQDIDSLETDSKGAGISISIDLSKDTSGYNGFN